MRQLQFDHVNKAYGQTVALRDVSLSIEPGEFLTLLGPSGSGKTTLLKIIAGFEQLDAGSMHLDGVDITNLAPGKRNIGMVFQSYALFPHLTVKGNVSFPLKIRGLPKADIDHRVSEALGMVELGELGHRYPSQLSGGQQQRVAVARAIVFGPQLLLLDEPFGALDRRLRDQLQGEIKRLQRKLNITTIFVTHDQEEALNLSDRIAVMNHGRVEQVSTPNLLYAEPATVFVAGFVGESNLWHVEVLATTESGTDVRLPAGTIVRVPRCKAAVGSRLHLLVRPEWIKPAIADRTFDNRYDGVITEIDYMGDYHRFHVSWAEGEIVLIWDLSMSPFGTLNRGDRVAFGWNGDSGHVIDSPAP